MITFEQLGLRSELLSSIRELGYEQPTPIQQEAIPQVVGSEKDLLATAQTGTGKTAAFGLPMLHKLEDNVKSIQGLVLCPTRELCLQVAADLKTYSKHMRNVTVTAVYGGSSIDQQIRELRAGSQIVVGTPGRTLDLIRRKKLIVSDIKFLVLDEADEMLSMGFQDDLDAILASSPEHKQTLLFSATMPSPILKMVNKYMTDPVTITVISENKSSENVTHAYFVVKNRDRYAAIKRLADLNPDIYGIIFCRTRRETKEVADSLAQDGYNADALHGDLSQAQRDQVMRKFRRKNLQLLVATDVASRGLDVDSLTHVINYNLPDDYDLYIHRSGRTGRGSNHGESLLLINPSEARAIKALERKIGKKIELRKVPVGADIFEKQLFSMIDRVENVNIDNSKMDAFMPAILEKLSEMDREDLIKRFVSIEFNRFAEYYNDNQDINANGQTKDRNAQRKNHNEDFATFFLSLGRRDKMEPTTIFRILDEFLPFKGIEIGKIEIFKNHTIIELDSKHKDVVLSSFQGAEYKGRTLIMRLSEFTQKPPKPNKKYKGKSNRGRKFGRR